METVRKNDLHIHLGGSWPMSFLEEIGDADDVRNLKSFLDAMDLKSETDYHLCFQAFGLAGKIVDSNEKVEAGMRALCLGLAADGVTYTEIRTGLKKYGSSSYEDYLAAVLRGLEAGCSGSSLTVNIILSLKRNSSLELAEETLRLVKKYGRVVGMDISDDALLGDGSAILAIMEETRSLSIPIALHLGECREETEEQQMRELEMLQPARIGHGVFLCERAKEWIYSRRLPIEMCLSSALKAHMVECASQHPALELIRQGYPVAVCTDDPLIFRTSHSQESELARSLLGYSVEQMQELHDQALAFRFEKK
jgi:adenosine deaminase